MASSDLTGIKLTTSEVEIITEDIKNASADLKEIMDNFRDIMADLTGQSEGGLIIQTQEAATLLEQGVRNLAESFWNLGIKIGNYLRDMLTRDADLAGELKNQIEK